MKLSNHYSNGRGGYPMAGRNVESPTRTPSYGYLAADDPEIGGLVGYWRTLRQGIWLVLLITLLAGAGALGLTLLQTPGYQSRTTLEIQPINPDFLNMREVSLVQQSSASVPEAQLLTQVEIMRSDVLLERVLDRIGDDPAARDGSFAKVKVWMQKLGLGGEPQAHTRSDAIANAREKMKVRASAETHIVQIRYESHDPKYSAAFANALTGEFIEYNMESRWETTQETGAWLTRQLRDLQVSLEESQGRLQEYARKSGLLYTADKNSIAEERLRQLQEALSEAQADRIGKQSRKELAASRPADALPEVLDDETLRGYQTELTALKRQEAELGTTYRAKHAKVKRVRAQLSALETELRKKRDTILHRIENEYADALRRERLLESDFESQADLVNQQAEKAIQYQILQREVDSTREIYDAMLQRVKEAGVAAALRATNVRVLDRARIPEKPYKPSKGLNTLLGLLIGSFGAAAFVILRESTDRTFRHPGDASCFLELPELGVIPATPNGIEGEKRRSAPTVNKKPEILQLLPAAEVVEAEIVTWQPQSSILAESFRATSTSILFAGHDEEPPRTLVVTSANPGEGKSTVASNLAVSLAGLRRSVLLIDADLRKPRVHSLFGISQKPGLSELLARRGPLSEATAHDSIQLMPTENLCVLPSGEITENSAQLLLSHHMEDLLRYYSRHFEFVLIDTPPMLHLPDARILGRMAHAVVLVVRAGKTTRETALAAKARLEGDGARVLGSVLNDWDSCKANRYGDRYDYVQAYYAKT